MQKYIVLIMGLFFGNGPLAADGVRPLERAVKIGDIRDSALTNVDLTCDNTSKNSPEADSLIIIYYGLNESNSNSWVRENSEGVVGITYFQRFEGSAGEGTLIYKTIHPTGSVNIDSVTTGRRLEKSVLLYDSLSRPHIFVARSNDNDQIIDHYFETDEDEWQNEAIIHFYNYGGRFIYELSADTGPDHSFHLLILKTRSDIDSNDYMNAWIDSYLFHMTDETGVWETDLIHQYDMAYTYDHYIKSSRRQDIKVDNDGYVHVVYSEQIDAIDDPSRLWYTNNRTGVWRREVALNNDYGIRDDAGWFPSLCLDNDGTPYISCMYVNRVYTRSAVYCRLVLLKRLGISDWSSETIAAYDDGYYASDGRTYTGSLSHLVFDGENLPHIVFSDVASAHWGIGGTNRLSPGNIRYGVLEDGAWDIRTIYRQPLPTSFTSATEMHGLCLIVSDLTDTIRVIGQDLNIAAAFQYTTSLVETSWARTPTDVEDDPGNSLPDRIRLFQNYPNPFNLGTSIQLDLPRLSQVTVTIYNVLGRQVSILVDAELSAGHHSIHWDGTDHLGRTVSTGIYFCCLKAEGYSNVRKMMLMK